MAPHFNERSPTDRRGGPCSVRPKPGGWWLARWAGTWCQMYRPKGCTSILYTTYPGMYVVLTVRTVYACFLHIAGYCPATTEGFWAHIWMASHPLPPISPTITLLLYVGYTGTRPPVTWWPVDNPFICQPANSVLCNRCRDRRTANSSTKL